MANNEWRNYVRDVEPIDETHTVMRFWGRPQISVVGAYGPTAQAQEAEKRKFWNELQRIVKEEDARGLALALGARIQAAQEGEEEYIGGHTFDRRNTTASAIGGGVGQQGALCGYVGGNGTYCHQHNV